MSGSVTNIFRHPIKSIGREPLGFAELVAGKTMPGDRVWAVSNDLSKFDPENPAWVSCGNFIRGAKAPSLMAFSATIQDDTYTITHAGSGETFSFDPDDRAQHTGFLAFLTRYIPENRAMPKSLVKVPERGMTDTDFPSISILSHASLTALADAAGKPVEMERFRANIWLEGFEAWAEREWIGQHLRIGGAEFVVREHIGRCVATTANPASGEQDVDTLALLRNNWGHTDFGIYAEVVKSGRVSLQDRVEIL